MNYGVDWIAVKSDYERIIETASDMAAVRNAILRLDAALSYCPERASESREGKRRIAFEPPLIATLKVNEAKSRVQILELRLREKPEQI